MQILYGLRKMQKRKVPSQNLFIAGSVTKAKTILSFSYLNSIIKENFSHFTVS